MSVTVKAYLYLGKVGQSETEIRRFSWETSGSFGVLQAKVSQVFPSLQQPNTKFTLFWKDAEGDHIAFSSDGELNEALKNAENNVFKIFITGSKSCPTPTAATGCNREGSPKGEEKKEQKEEGDDGPHHPHVICDGCDGPVKGVRFKCNVCVDYDLCRKCKRQGKHSEHQMTAIRRPMPHPWAGVFVNGRQFGPGGCRTPPHFGLPPFCPPPCNPEGAGTGPGCQGQGFGGPPPNFHGPWGHFFRKQMRSFWREQGKQQEKGEDDKTAEEKEHNEDEDDTECSPEEYLQKVGEQVAAMLDPLGIDVQVDVEHAASKTTCGEKGKGPQGSSMDAAQGSSNSNSDENEWTLVTSDKPSPDEQIDDEPTHNGIPLFEPKIAHALNQMKAMGFSDDGGWLSRLLIAKEGDIGQVLDALKPSLSAAAAHNQDPRDHLA